VPVQTSSHRRGKGILQGRRETTRRWQNLRSLQEFEQAVRSSPRIESTSSKLQETGKVASVSADTLGQEAIQRDLKEARRWFDEALRYDSANALASQHRAELNRSILDAQVTAHRAIEAIKRGETTDTEGILANLSRFRPVVLDIGFAEKELRADRTLEQAQSEWARRDRINALRDIEHARLPPPRTTPMSREALRN